MASRDAFIYEVKYGRKPRPIVFSGVFLLVCVVILLEPGALWKRIVVVGIFGILALFTAATVVKRQTALRVDSSGVTLRQYPEQPSSAAFYPWEDVEKVLIWQFQGLTFVGVRRREGAAPRPRFVAPSSRAELTATTPGVPLEVAASAAPVKGWLLDADRLVGAVARFAPTVEVRDTSGRPANG